MKEHVGISKLKKHRNKIGIVQNYMMLSEMQKERKKERKKDT